MKETAAPPERLDIILAIKAKDPTASEQVITYYWEYIRYQVNYFYRNIHKRRAEDNDDVFQITCLKIHNKIYTFKANSKLSTWLFRLIRNECLMALRRANATKEKNITLSEDHRTYANGQRINYSGRRDIEVLDDHHLTNCSQAAHHDNHPDYFFLKNIIQASTPENIREFADDEHRKPYFDILSHAIENKGDYPKLAESLSISVPALKSRIWGTRNIIKKIIKSIDIDSSYSHCLTRTGTDD